LVLLAEAFHILTATTAILTFSVSSFFPIIRCISFMHGNAPAEAVDKRWMAAVVRDHWKFSRWLVASSLVAIPALNVQTVIASYFLNLEDIGILRAVAIFTTPAAVFSTAIVNTTIPLLVRDYGDGDLAEMIGKGRRLSFFLAIVTAAYASLIWVLATPIDMLLYNGKYHDYMWLVAILGLAPVVTAIGSGWTYVLRAAQQTRHVFGMTAVGGILSLIGAIVLMPRLGLTGAAMSSLLAPLFYMLTVHYVGRRWAGRARLAAISLGNSH
jgi:O-antigen/teichoic acid export membrane protein